MKNKRKKISIESDWDFLSEAEAKVFNNMTAMLGLRQQLSNGGFWGVREAKKISFAYEDIRYKFFKNIYKTRPHFDGKGLMVKFIHEQLSVHTVADDSQIIKSL